MSSRLLSLGSHSICSFVALPLFQEKVPVTFAYFLRQRWSGQLRGFVASVGSSSGLGVCSLHVHFHKMFNLVPRRAVEGRLPVAVS